jgi:hypothetical protein
MRAMRRRKIARMGKNCKNSNYSLFSSFLPALGTSRQFLQFLTPAGTVANRDRVCFACPNFQGGNPMSESNQQHDDRWNRVIVPMAKGLEAFFWRVAWFTLFVTVLFFSARGGR